MASQVPKQGRKERGMTSASLSSVQALSQILIREQASCCALLDTVEEERRAIKALAITEFHDINLRRIAILETLQTLTQTRETAVRQISEMADLPEAVTSLQVLLDRWQSPHVAELRRHHDTLMVVAKRAREEIKQNVVLIEGIRHVIEGALAAGIATMSGADAYNRSGQRATLQSSAAVLYQQG